MNNIIDLNKKFTILSATFNKEPYLMDWADSILSQKYRPLEVVLVDDCSRDNTSNLIKEINRKFVKADISLRYIKNRKRLYCSSSYRRAFKNSDSNFYGVVDADDMLCPNVVEYIMSIYMKYPEIAWIYTQFQICNRKMIEIKDGFCRLPVGYDSLLASGEKRKHMYSHWRTFSRRCHDIDHLWPQGLRCAVDKYMGYRLEELGPGMFVNKVCYRYRQNVKNSICVREQTKETWKKLVQAAVIRRQQKGLKPYPIIEGE